MCPLHYPYITHHFFNTGVNGPVKDWHLGAIPIINMTAVKARSSYGQAKPVVPSYEVNLHKG